jgi:crotonobetainyl-CoA:carnitine CoA-transferase CaiB-like acyl-CoA transferase
VHAHDNRADPAVPRPFKDLVVVELGQIYSGPYCGLMFAHLGADVIKIESPRGELLRYRENPGVDSREFVMLNSSKRSLPLDLKTPEGRAVFLDLIANADVLIENFSLGVMDRLGLGMDVLHEHNPRLVYARGTGYGSDGVHSGYSAMDLTVQALAGVISTTGFPDGSPVKTGPAFVDFMAGIHLFAAAVSALYQRERDGQGQLVQAAMYDAVVPALASPMAAHESGKNAPERVGNRHSGLSVAPYNVYPALDGYIAIFCVSNRHWRRLLTCMQAQHLMDDQRFATPYSRAKFMDEVDDIVAAWTSARPRAEVVETLRREDVPSAPVQTVDEVRHDEHLIANGMIQTVQHWALGEVVAPGCAIRLEGAAPISRLAPELGADTSNVLHDLLGYDDRRVQDLLAAGITVQAAERAAPGVGSSAQVAASDA